MSFRFHLGAGLLACTCAFSSALHAGESAATAPQPLWKAVRLPEAAAGLVLRGLLVRKGLPALAVGDGGALLVSQDRGESC